MELLFFIHPPSALSSKGLWDSCSMLDVRRFMLDIPHASKILSGVCRRYAIAW
jgi:hypothetical protein